MDGVFDHEDPNNRPEEIPLDDLGGNNDDDDDEYFDSHDNLYGETSFTTGGEIPIEMVDDKGRRIKSLSDNSEYQRLKREHDLENKAKMLKFAILDITKTNWNASIDSLNSRDFLDNIEIKKNGSIWYKGKIVYKKVGEKCVVSRDKRSVKYTLEFRQQLQDINTDSLEKFSSNNQKIEQLNTVNAFNSLSDIPVEISVKRRI